MLTSLWFLWGLLLYAVIAGHASWPVYLTGIAAVICAITILPERKRKNVMFGKKKQADTPETEPVAAPLQKPEKKEKKKKNEKRLNSVLRQMKLPSCCQHAVKRNSARWRLLNPASRR
ncbi:hypothetical protein N6Y36_04970 [Morganella morganii]|nr:hypothetical protein N6Y36_04970 [Morganella morganii]